MAVPGSQEPGTAAEKRKRESDDAKRKLLVNERVEVRSVEEGFQGSWHSGIVVGPEEKRVRHVSYDHLLADDESGPLVEAISVSPVLDGDSHLHHHHRGNIRPHPPWVPVSNWDLHYGLCVEAEYQDAWWEGVVLDHEDGSPERRVFFPDLGDELVMAIDSLRITRDWDESTGEWDRRGSWLLFELIENFEQSCGDILPVSVTQIWYDIRQTRDFEEVREWTRWDQRDLWKKMVSEVCLLYLKFFPEELCRRSKLGSLVPVDSHSTEALAGVTTQVSYDLKSSESDDTKRWQLATSEMVPRPEFHPEAVDKYIQCSNGDLKGSKIRLSVQKDLWKHLLYLGWKIEYSYENRMPRKRYIQPGGGKCLYSLIQVCKHLTKSAGDETRRLDGSLSIEKLQEGPQPVVDRSFSIKEVRPDSSSGPILEYCRAQGQKVDHGTLRSLRLKVQEQLLAEGWMINSYYNKNKGRDILVLRSPTGKPLYSFISACKYYLDEISQRASSATSSRMLIRLTVGKKRLSANNTESFDTSDTGSRKVKGIQKPHKKRDCSVLGFATPGFESDIHKLENGSVKSWKQKPTRDTNPGFLKPKIRKTSRAFVNMKKDKHVDERVACLLRSSKSVQEFDGPDSSHGDPRSILSWLIDNNVFLPRSKVRYINETENLIMGEGRVTRSGIKCGCCSKLFALSGFAVHAGGKRSKAVTNIFLEDGRSIFDCQKLVISRLKKQSFMTESSDRIKSSCRPSENDYICSVCHYGGELMLCDRCPSSFHKSCLGLKDVPEGDWFCPSCCCGVCGAGKFLKDKEHAKDGNILTCSQCARKYHIGCLKKKHRAKKKSNSAGYWFCDKICKKIYKKLQKLIGKWTTLGAHNLTWSLLKSTKTDSWSTVSDEIDAVQKYCQLNVALGVMHECFKPVKESHTQRDLMEDILFSRESELQRLNFQGFYTVVLARNEELISVATVRIHGKKVAEVPLVGTRFQYRRLGMCRVLMNQLEKKLMEIGVERLVLPAVPSVLNTWTTSFGFSQMTASERLHFLDFTFLDFQDTIMCQKLLTKIPITELNPLKGVDAIQPGYYGINGDIERSSADSEVYQAEQTEDIQIACQEQPENYAGHRTDAESLPATVLLPACQPQNSESRSCVGVTETIRDFSFDLGNRPYSVNFFSKLYKRRKYKDQD